MCGIVGIISDRDVLSRIIKSLKKLEYRGYDSAGVALIDKGKVNIRKVVGKISALEQEIIHNPAVGNTGIGHTRWATHGEPVKRNAHPFAKDGVALVHNGIIENHQKFKHQLIANGHTFESETDSEVVLHLFLENLKKTNDPVQAATRTFGELEGAFAIAIVFENNPDLMIGMRKGAPLAVGIGDGEMMLGSDLLALSEYASQILYLEDGEIAIINKTKYQIIDNKGKVLEKKPQAVGNETTSSEKGEYSHFMLKEIYEQPAVVADILNHYYDASSQSFNFKDRGIDWSKYQRISIVACGTSYHSALVARYWFEKLSELPVVVDIASEFRYRTPMLSRDTLGIVISQSGETADTLAALRLMKQHGIDTLALINVEHSTIGREAKYVCPLYAGFEIGVASTKAFTAQLMVLAMLCLDAASSRKTLNNHTIKQYLNHLSEIPSIMDQVLTKQPECEELAIKLKKYHNLMYMGRGINFPNALEGALKIKEISYIHAEGFAAGELKHGSIALIDDSMPVIAIAPHDPTYSKMASNIHEVCARKGIVFALTDIYGEKEIRGMVKGIIRLPTTNEISSPIIYSVPMQLIAYYAALHLDRDVDQPRNLAKSVTVE